MSEYDELLQQRAELVEKRRALDPMAKDYDAAMTELEKHRPPDRLSKGYDGGELGSALLKVYDGLINITERLMLIAANDERSALLQANWANVPSTGRVHAVDKSADDDHATPPSPEQMLAAAEARRRQML